MTAGPRGAPVALPYWVPTHACSLPSEEQPLRLEEFDELFADSLHTIDRLEDERLRIRLSSAAETRARDLMARETDCCTFFVVDIRRAGDEVLIDVRVPASRAEVLDGIERQARTARTRSAP